MIDKHRFVDASSKFLKPPAYHPSYGTAGFRANASLLDSTLFRCGVLMAIRSACLEGQHTGIMITASHNPAPDNGVKLVDPTGYMLEQSWEQSANELAQANNDLEVYHRVQGLSQQLVQGQGSVFLGHDTRPSAGQLARAARAGIEAAGGAVVDLGLITTPQLHWMLRQSNRRLPSSEDDYFSALSRGYKAVLAAAPAPQSFSAGQVLRVDCANGVGADKLAELAVQLPASLRVSLVNSGSGELNYRCGADFLQKELVVPAGFEGIDDGIRCASMDGDADRLVYFSQEGGQLQLMDGDKLAALGAVVIADALKQLPGAKDLKVGVVQTAYANGASTAFLRNQLGWPVVTTPTGVKHLHKAAMLLDLAIYFEANGHGTITFSEDLLARLASAAEQGIHSAQLLLAVSQMVNQAVGDALSLLLLVEAALVIKGWGLTQWAELYHDLPSRQLKVMVADRSRVTTANAEDRCVTPPGLQAQIDSAVSSVASGRAFVRPSGTEDVVRVYAEASTRQAADELALRVARLVWDTAGGVGQRP